MSVIRYDLNNCIGCRNCVTVCPMDVFRFDENEMKSVIAYPENCQSCGQCFMGCKGRSLEMSFYQASYALAAARAAVSDGATPAAVKEATLAQPAKSAEEAAASAESSGSSGWSGSK
ncbi:4Fe-4S dicluster domain-containing protein [Eggerthella sinensis]|jgi:NAD-dependent dihydropyrimidine dehydrogenase PreA subunit|uniref:4Fe-4S ferredoxin n=1 Tax=Eggerthella sinensis TaxID=242230 RepID=A0A3N0J295_9ACTN|nr:4Fe-4S dicluster domain-containing protein [Eggerthella sinensis]MCB7036350.1 4Fe-4S dicluster domain-containing protein [Eggerthella sinensis]RDB71872.1 4Fe-4S ferredoxin [Eggerthella sinensis]RNM42830.1 4Fe-4S ferredoxin [Eggerthella sinensis]